MAGFGAISPPEVQRKNLKIFGSQASAEACTLAFESMAGLGAIFPRKNLKVFDSQSSAEAFY